MAIYGWGGTGLVVVVVVVLLHAIVAAQGEDLSWLSGEALGYRISEYDGYAQCARTKFDLAPIAGMEPINSTIAITTRRSTFAGMHSNVGPLALLHYFKTEAWHASLKTNIGGRQLNMEGLYFSCMSQSSVVVCELAMHFFPFVPATAGSVPATRDDDSASINNITDVVIIPLDPTQQGDENTYITQTLNQHFSLHKKGIPSGIITAVNPLPFLQEGTFIETEPLPNWRYPCRNATFWLRMEPVLVSADVLGILYELTKPTEGDEVVGSTTRQAQIRSVQQFSPAPEVIKSTLNGNVTVLDRYYLVNGEVELYTGELGIAAITLAVLTLQALAVVLLLVWKRRTFVSDLRGSWIHPLTQRQFFGVPKRTPIQYSGSETGSTYSRNPLVPPGRQ